MERSQNPFVEDSDSDQIIVPRSRRDPESNNMENYLERIAARLESHSMSDGNALLTQRRLASDSTLTDE
jgi:hypothetical protein